MIQFTNESEIADSVAFVRDCVRRLTESLDCLELTFVATCDGELVVGPKTIRTENAVYQVGEEAKSLFASVWVNSYRLYLATEEGKIPSLFLKTTGLKSLGKPLTWGLT